MEQYNNKEEEEEEEEKEKTPRYRCENKTISAR